MSDIRINDGGRLYAVRLAYNPSRWMELGIRFVTGGSGEFFLLPCLRKGEVGRYGL